MTVNFSSFIPENSKQQIIYTALLWALIILIYYNMMEWHSLRNNEFITLRVLENGYYDIWLERIQNNHMPLYFILLKSWTEVFGTGQTALRFLSMLGGLIGIFFVWRVAVHYLGRNYGLLVLFYAGLNQSILDVSSEARMYSWVFGISAALVWAYSKWLETGLRKYSVWMFVISLFGLYVHLLFYFVILSVLIGIYFASNERVKRKSGGYIPLLAAFVLNTPVLYYWSTVQYRIGTVDGEATGGIFHPNAFMSAFHVFFGNDSYVNHFVDILAIPLGIMCIYVVSVGYARNMLPTKNRFREIIWLYLFVFWAMVLITGIASANSAKSLAGVERYFIPIAIGTAPLLACTVMLLNKIGKAQAARVFAIAVGLCTLATQIIFTLDPGLGIRGASLELKQELRETDSVIASRCTSRLAALVYYGAMRSNSACWNGEEEPEATRQWLQGETSPGGRFWVIYIESPFSDDGKEASRQLYRLLDSDEGVSLIGDVKKYGETYLALYERK